MDNEDDHEDQENEDSAEWHEGQEDGDWLENSEGEDQYENDDGYYPDDEPDSEDEEEVPGIPDFDPLDGYGMDTDRILSESTSGEEYPTSVHQIAGNPMMNSQRARARLDEILPTTVEQPQIQQVTQVQDLGNQLKTLGEFMVWQKDLQGPVQRGGSLSPEDAAFFSSMKKESAKIEHDYKKDMLDHNRKMRQLEQERLQAQIDHDQKMRQLEEEEAVKRNQRRARIADTMEEHEIKLIGTAPSPAPVVNREELEAELRQKWENEKESKEMRAEVTRLTNMLANGGGLPVSEQAGVASALESRLARMEQMMRTQAPPENPNDPENMMSEYEKAQATIRRYDARIEQLTGVNPTAAQGGMGHLAGQQPQQPQETPFYKDAWNTVTGFVKSPVGQTAINTIMGQSSGLDAAAIAARLDRMQTLHNRDDLSTKQRDRLDLEGRAKPGELDALRVASWETMKGWQRANPAAYPDAVLVGLVESQIVAVEPFPDEGPGQPYPLPQRPVGGLAVIAMKREKAAKQEKIPTLMPTLAPGTQAEQISGILAANGVVDHAGFKVLIPDANGNMVQWVNTGNGWEALADPVKTHPYQAPIVPDPPDPVEVRTVPNPVSRTITPAAAAPPPDNDSVTLPPFVTMSCEEAALDPQIFDYLLKVLNLKPRTLKGYLGGKNKTKTVGQALGSKLEAALSSANAGEE